ncbi:zinc-binding dehydrogenase [Limosilactobacillus sp. STM2_1]|uniref:Zinc-binding dehydrogenase n=1 Tax=Limosilactobacillus rudii TaxID=2759755 RepID=A0A7W3UL13_9LACO|nr:zinc-binding dehydrogenase [Limosilactobacillus rudii]MBB1079488.1 zinc-binding dehydrogenase [Limosilactobacillus rudii]MBB1097534.1 zinc-binding dehydrogenase [Limosilactobacillus rudii]MCD7134644.1 zinc-binding dehydrogenase [Limosilactobacillus rudii]
MKALVLASGTDHSLDKLKISDVPVPQPNENEVLIKVHAAGINPVDYKIVENGVESWTYPHILGLDVAGEIVGVGKNVTKWQIGDRVSGHGDLTKNGCFAEYVAVPAYELAKIPATVTYTTAASFLCGALTAYQAIERKANLTAVQSVLVHAGAGGVGSIAIQLAKRHGCKVFTTVSSSKKDYVEQLAPDAIIDYRIENVTQRLNELTNGLGVDLIVNTVGKQEAEKDLERLAYNGRLVTIVDVPSINNVPMFARGLGMDVVNLGGAHLSGNPHQQRDLGQMNAEMLQLVANKEIKPLSIKILPFTQIIEGLKMVKMHQVVGKVVVKIN